MTFQNKAETEGFLHPEDAFDQPGPGQAHSGPGPVAEYVRALKESDRLAPLLTCHTVLPETPARSARPVRPLPKALVQVLENMGIPSLYTHQAEAVDALRSGRSVIVATPTASGKSLCYTLPVIERFLHDPEARSLFLFPLKALAQDQLASFRAMTGHWPEQARPRAMVYDGDTTAHFRKKIRENPPEVLLTNPEMLHLSLLPHHHLWSTLFAGLSLIVVDEVHTYRGVLGAHMAQVFRRLLRVAAHYGASPVFCFCSATVGNPAELAGLLTGESPLPILESGSPQGKRHYLFVNPDESPSSTAIRLLKSALKRGLRTIVYCQSRRMTELISVWASEQSGPFSKRISAYRAGFLPEERRTIESRMSSGELLAVITTSALELGIDIGSLDLCILVGYPGTVMSTLQRGGRVGRGMQESAVVLIAQEDALDQYIVRHAGEFFDRPPELAVLNPENPVIVERHLQCAAAELPIRPARQRDAAWLSPEVTKVVETLEQRGLLLRSADGQELLAARKRPHHEISLRGSGSTIGIEDESGRLIGSVDGVRAMREAHPGSIYLHLGQYFEIVELDLAGGRALARPCRPTWYTRTRSNKETDILSLDGQSQVAGIPVQRGRLRITDSVTGYEKRATHNGQLMGVVPLDLPPVVFETEGFWFQVPRPAQERIEAARMHFMGSIHALEHAAIGILPLAVMADRNDFGGISTPLHLQTGRPTVFIYDGMPGGAGLCRAAFQKADEFFPKVLQVMTGCACELGCPSCVHSPKCGSGNRPIDKEGAMRLLEDMLFQPDNRPEAARILEDPPSGLETGRQAAGRLPEPPPSALRARVPEGRHYFGLAATQQAEAAFSPAPASVPGPGPLPVPTASGAQGNPAVPIPTFLRKNRPGQGGTPDPAPQITGLSRHIVPPDTDFVVVDVETRLSAAEVGGWHKAGRMGVSVAVVYDSRDGEFTGYTQDRLPEMAGVLASSSLVVGFNLLRFDYTVLEPHVPGFSFRALPTLDMLIKVREQLSYRLSLDNLARATLEAPKSADGLQALRWWKEGRLDQIEAYCRDDVRLTRDLFLFGRSNGYLLFTNKAGQKVRVRAPWSAPCPVDCGGPPQDRGRF